MYDEVDKAEDRLARMVSELARQMRAMIAAIVDDIKTQDGKIQKNAYNITRINAATRALRAEISSRGLDDLRRSMQDRLQRISADILSSAGDLGIDDTFSSASRQAISALADAGDRDVVSLVGAASDKMSTYLMRAVLGGADKAEMLSTLQHMIDVTEKQANTLLQTILNSFARQLVVMQAEEHGIEEYAYVGPDDDITRQWCSHWVGMRGTPDEFEATGDKWDRENQPMPVMVYGGGYNCRHRFVPITKANVDKYSRGPA